MTIKRTLATIVLALTSALGVNGCGDSTERTGPSQSRSTLTPTDPRYYNYRFWDESATVAWETYVIQRNNESKPLTQNEVMDLSAKMYKDNLRRNAGTFRTGVLGYKAIDEEAVKNVCYSQQK